MFWTLIVITLLPINERQQHGVYSKYYTVSKHETRAECEVALDMLIEKPSRHIILSKNQKVTCIKTD
jgi:hypothetical protein